MIGKHLKKIRLSRGLMQSDVAFRSGVNDHSKIAHYETEAGDPNVATLKKLCLALSCSSDYLLGLCDSESSCIDHMRHLVEAKNNPNLDQRWVSIAITEFEKFLLVYNRAIQTAEEPRNDL